MTPVMTFLDSDFYSDDFESQTRLIPEKMRLQIIGIEIGIFLSVMTPVMTQIFECDDPCDDFYSDDLKSHLLGNESHPKP